MLKELWARFEAAVQKDDAELRNALHELIGELKARIEAVEVHLGIVHVYPVQTENKVVSYPDSITIESTPISLVSVPEVAAPAVEAAPVVEPVAAPVAEQPAAPIDVAPVEQPVAVPETAPVQEAPVTPTETVSVPDAPVAEPEVKTEEAPHQYLPSASDQEDHTA